MSTTSPTIAAGLSQILKAFRTASPCTDDCGCDDACGLERVRYFPRQVLGAEDMRTEQHYFREKLRRHNRFLHGWGVVCGCEVKPAPEQAKPYQVLICPGYLITQQGDEIMIGAPALFDLATCLVQSDDPCAFSTPCPPVTPSTPTPSKIYLSVCYKECEVRPVRVAPLGCSCDDAQCDYSRIRDAYEFSCLSSLPASYGIAQPTCQQLCQGGVFPCPCPTDNCVVLATIRISPDKLPQTTNLTKSEIVTHYLTPGNSPLDIDNTTDRRLLYSTAMLQTMAMCNCGQEPQVDTPVITNVGTSGSNPPTWIEVTVAEPVGAQIYYTIDGSDPSATNPNASLFGANHNNVPLQNDQLPVTFKAIGVHPGYNNSAIASLLIPQPQT